MVPLPLPLSSSRVSAGKGAAPDGGGGGASATATVWWAQQDTQPVAILGSPIHPLIGTAGHAAVVENPLSIAVVAVVPRSYEKGCKVVRTTTAHE